MALIVVGVNHTTASVEVREKLAFRPPETLVALAQFRADGVSREGVVLSTCNRTEVYLVEQNGIRAKLNFKVNLLEVNYF